MVPSRYSHFKMEKWGHNKERPDQIKTKTCRADMKLCVQYLELVVSSGQQRAGQPCIYSLAVHNTHRL